MAQTIRRGGKTVRKVAAASGTKRKVHAARRQTGSVLDQIMQWIPFSEETLHRILMVIILGGAAVLMWVVASMAGVPQLAEAQMAQIAGKSGFEVKRVEVRGVNRMNELKIYEKVLGQRDQAMSRLDIAALRDQLLQLSWVKDARVSRQLPDTLVVDVVERSPHAVLRRDNKLTLIDETGHPLEAVNPAKAKGLLVLSGNGAEARVPDLVHLLDAAPAIRPQVTEAEWV
ncbi:MAG: FtsQ-type POTRA domain-containing protein, partial [Novosphingobium sp.]|nr:FtsQ-type POTRA domain-containing protein [Novosphingobium sp.]